MTHALATIAIAAALLARSAAITIDDFKPASLSGSGKTLELSIEGDENGANPGPTWTLTFEKSPANQATVREFPGSTGASATTWAYTGPPFQDAHGYSLSSTTAFGNQPASIDFWISVPGPRFYLTYGTKNYYGAVAFRAAVPDIAVRQPATVDLTDGSSEKSFGSVRIGTKGRSRTFTIANVGTAALKGISIKKSGADKKDFKIGTLENPSLAAGGKAKFKITFKPSSKGTKNAAIAIKSNDPDESPFNIKLTGQGKR